MTQTTARDWTTVSGDYKNANEFLLIQALPLVEGEVLEFSPIEKKRRYFGEATSYVAVRHEDDSVSALVILITHYKEHGNNYHFCIMPEEDCPLYFNCPKSIFDRLTPNNKDHSEVWRRNCLNLANKKLKKVRKNA